MQGLETNGGKEVVEAGKSKDEVVAPDSLVEENVGESPFSEEHATFFDPLLREASPDSERGLLGSNGFGQREIGLDAVDPLLFYEVGQMQSLTWVGPLLEPDRCWASFGACFWAGLRYWALLGFYFQH